MKPHLEKQLTIDNPIDFKRSALLIIWDAFESNLILNSTCCNSYLQQNALKILNIAASGACNLDFVIFSKETILKWEKQSIKDSG